MIQITLRPIDGSSSSEERIQRPERPQRANPPQGSSSPLQSFIIRSHTGQNVAGRDELPRPNAPVQDDNYNNRSISPLFANQSTLAVDSNFSREVVTPGSPLQSSTPPPQQHSSRTQLANTEYVDTPQFNSTTLNQEFRVTNTAGSGGVASSSALSIPPLRHPQNTLFQTGTNSGGTTSSNRDEPIEFQRQRNSTNRGIGGIFRRASTSGGGSTAVNNMNADQVEDNNSCGNSSRRLDRTLSSRVRSRRSSPYSSQDATSPFLRPSQFYTQFMRDRDRLLGFGLNACLNLTTGSGSGSSSAFRNFPSGSTLESTGAGSSRTVNRGWQIWSNGAGEGIPRRPFPREHRPEHSAVPISPLINLVEADDEPESSSHSGNNVSTANNNVSSMVPERPNISWLNRNVDQNTVRNVTWEDHGIGPMPNTTTEVHMLEEEYEDDEEGTEIEDGIFLEDAPTRVLRLPASRSTVVGQAHPLPNGSGAVSGGEEPDDDDEVFMNVPPESVVEVPSSDPQARLETLNDGSRVDIRQLVLSTLECPICFDYVSPPVSQCYEGHVVCFRCRSRLTHCPECRGPFSPVRNLVLEKLASNMEYPCNYEGCTQFVAPTDRMIHSKSCVFRNFMCPIAPTACSWTGVRLSMRNHVLSCHETQNHWVTCDKWTFTMRPQIGSDRVFVMNTLDHLFLVKFSVTSPNKLKGCVTLLGYDALRTQNIKVILLVQSLDLTDPHEIIVRSPLLENDEMDMRLQRFAVFNIAELMQNTTPQTMIRVRIAIGKRDMLEQVDRVFE